MRAHLLKFQYLIRQLRVTCSRLEESVIAALSVTLTEPYLPEHELTYELMKTRFLRDESELLNRMHSYQETLITCACDHRDHRMKQQV